MNNRKVLSIYGKYWIGRTYKSGELFFQLKFKAHRAQIHFTTPISKNKSALVDSALGSIEYLLKSKIRVIEKSYIV